MTAYTDQFDRRNPLEFAPSAAMMASWPLQLAVEARGQLQGRTVDQLKSIAAVVEFVIHAEALRATIARVELDAMAYHKGKPFQPITAGDVPAEMIEFTRITHGDLALFTAAGGTKAMAECPSLPEFDFPDHQTFAVVALWKLIDAHDVYARLYSFDEDGKAELDKLDVWACFEAMNGGAAHVIEAATACATAAHLMTRNDTIAAFKESTHDAFMARLEADEQMRTRDKAQQASAAAKVRWKDRDRHRVMAKEYADSRPFRSRAEAARQAGNYLMKEANGEIYTVETIESWLAKDGWKRQPA
jgi:hypothetical protein